MPLFEKINTLYGKSGGTPLHLEFHYKLISTWLERIRSLLLMWRLLTQRGIWWLWGSLIDQHVQLQNLAPFLKSTNIESFKRGTILFQWPWKCTTQSGVIWIISSRNMLIFSTIDNQKVIYPCLFAINFSSNMLILLSNMLYPLLWKRRLRWQVMFVLDPPLLLDLMISMLVT
jgi:hypothetical protein